MVGIYNKADNVHDIAAAEFLTIIKIYTKPYGMRELTVHTHKQWDFFSHNHNIVILKMNDVV